MLAPRPAPSDATLPLFERLLDEYGGKVNRLARRFTASESDAEDLTQEIFLDVFRSLPNFRGESAPGTWIYRIAIHHCLRFREKANREAQHRAPDALPDEAPETAPDPAQRAMQSELSQQVHEALGKLPLHHQSVIVLHELHGLTYGECAQILNVPIGTVKSRLSGAFRALRRSLATYVLGDAPPGRALRPDPPSPTLQTTGESS